MPGGDRNWTRMNAKSEDELASLDFIRVHSRLNLGLGRPRAEARHFAIFPAGSMHFAPRRCVDLWGKSCDFGSKAPFWSGGTAPAIQSH